MMQTQEKLGTVIIVAARRPDASVEIDLQAHGLEMQWARSIQMADDLLNSAMERTAMVAELAFPDGNWRDLIERVRCKGKRIPVVLLTRAVTAELWWDALECGVDDILSPPLAASRLWQVPGTPFQRGNGPV